MDHLVVVYCNSTQEPSNPDPAQGLFQHLHIQRPMQGVKLVQGTMKPWTQGSGHHLRVLTLKAPKQHQTILINIQVTQ